MSRVPVIIREAVSPGGYRVTLTVHPGYYAAVRWQQKDPTSPSEARYVPLIYGLIPAEERRVPKAQWGPYRARKGAKVRALAVWETLCRDEATDTPSPARSSLSHRPGLKEGPSQASPAKLEALARARAACRRSSEARS